MATTMRKIILTNKEYAQLMKVIFYNEETKEIARNKFMRSKQFSI